MHETKVLGHGSMSETNTVMRDSTIQIDQESSLPLYMILKVELTKKWIL